MKVPTVEIRKTAVSKIEVKRGRRSRLVWVNPSVDDRASPCLFDRDQKDSPTRKGVETAMDKFMEVAEEALWGNYDYPEKLNYVEQQLERLRIDLLNFDRIKSQQVA